MEKKKGALIIDPIMILILGLIALGLVLIFYFGLGKRLTGFIDLFKNLLNIG